MRNVRVVTIGTMALWLLSQPARAENGTYLCGSGSYHNELTCSPASCMGTLIPTCSAPEGFTTGSATISFLQGVCDDLGPIPCAGKFKVFYEGCGGTRVTNHALNTARVSGMFRLCYDPSGSGQCTGTGLEILKGSESWENYSIGSAPTTAQGDHTISAAKTFTFNGKKRKLGLKHGFSVTTGESGPCNATDCGFGGCLYKTQ